MKANDLMWSFSLNLNLIVMYQILEELACVKSDAETCKSQGRYIPENDYNMALAYTNSIQDILDIIPTLRSLTQCGIVKDKFSYVAAHLCRPFRVSARLQWSSLLTLSIFMVILVSIWIAKAYQDRGRCFSSCCITPKPHASDRFGICL